MEVETTVEVAGCGKRTAEAAAAAAGLENKENIKAGEMQRPAHAKAALEG